MSKKISELTQENPLIAAEIPIAQSGSTVGITLPSILGFSGQMFLSDVVGALATTVYVKSLFSASANQGGWIVIDPYTSECEVRKVVTANLASNSITIAALAYAHDINDLVLWLPNNSVDILWFGAKFDGATDDITAFDRAFAASSYVKMPAGTTVISSVLDIPSGGVLVGMGHGLTTIDASGFAGAAILAPRQAGSLDGFRLIGDDTAGSYGVMTNDDHNPLRATWGTIRISDFEIGLNITATNAGYGIYTNNFGRVFIDGCVTGLRISSTGAPIKINANSFIHLSVHSCTTALLLDRVQGLTIGYLHAESGTLGVDVNNAILVTILGGWVEGFTTNFDIADAPDAAGFVYLGSSDDTAADYDYTYGSGRSDLLGFRAGAPFYRLAGRWYFDHLERGPGQGFIDNAQLRGHAIGNSTVTTGATISVSKYSHILLNYGAGQALTDLTDNIDWQVVVLTAQTTNATIADAGNFMLSAAWNPANTGDNITLMYNSGFAKWVELSRVSV